MNLKDGFNKSNESQELEVSKTQEVSKFKSIETQTETAKTQEEGVKTELNNDKQ